MSAQSRRWRALCLDLRARFRAAPATVSAPVSARLRGLRAGVSTRWLTSTVAAFVGGALASASMAEAMREGSPFPNLATFARALAHIETSYVGDVDQNSLINGAIRGMLRTLDPHSEYMDAEQYRLFLSDTRGRFAGIGVEIDVRDGWLVVTAVFPGSPAERSGMRPGDRFLTIDGQRARDMPIEDAVRRMRGEPQTEVHIALRREDDAPKIELVLRREMIAVDAVEASLLPGDMLYVRLRVFQETVARELSDVLDHALLEARAREGVRGLLLDLRDNPGGYVDQAAAVADEFLDDGVIVSTRGRDGRGLSVEKARRAGTRPPFPIVVLVNGYTASAAEIVAAALRDHGRAVIVGTKTFGKGSVQNIIELPDHSALKLTIARYYTPSGVSIQARGIEPDVVVAQIESGMATPGGLSEAGLDGHLAATAGDAALPTTLPRAQPRRSPSEVAPELLAKDFQARMALETLRAIALDRELSRSH